MKRLAWIPLMVGCIASDPDGPGPVPGDAALGMNDITMLMPLPATLTTPRLAKMTDGGDLVPRDVFTRLVVTPGDVFDPYEQFHVIAIRFDLCDRVTLGACSTSADGRLRIVFQPIISGPVVGTTSANDVALHAFYPIPNAELGAVIAELRELSAMGGGAMNSPLAINAAVASGNAAYIDKLRALVLRYASADSLSRLTLFAQNAMAASLNWAFRGVERTALGFSDMTIPGVAMPEQRTILLGLASYDVMPVVDQPQGFVTVIDGMKFTAAQTSAREGALTGLVDSLHPGKHNAETLQCVTCHVSTFLLEHRADVAQMDPLTLPGRFTSSYDLSIAAGTSATDERSLRAFGWLFEKPMISQRVANETAAVLDEIGQRFPAL